MKKNIDIATSIVRTLEKLGPSSPRLILVKGAKAADKAPSPPMENVITLREPLAARTADGRIVLIHADGPGIPTVIDAQFAGPLTELLKAA